MTAFLLDVNVLIAIGWRAHSDHVRAVRWFSKQSVKGWASCPFTQAGFVRIVSNPSFSLYAPSPREAIELLSFNLRHPKHQFWPDDLTLEDALSHFTETMTGHKQVTDAYLVGLALRKKGRFATFDQSVRSLLSPSIAHDVVELIPHNS